jgi:anti-anti-sigma factor
MIGSGWPAFDVSVERAAATAIVRVAGELDLDTATQLADVLRDLEGSAARIVLDVSELEFIDSAGLRLAVVEHERATVDGFEFVIAGAERNVLRVLRLTGLDVRLPLAPDVASALGDGHRDVARPRAG